jgi:hypothetical protein
MDKSDILSFCPCCFASSETGSWAHNVVSGYCTNCGNGSTITIPRWAVDEIRRNASWVGKRYYPDKEDEEHLAERKALLELVDVFPGRLAQQNEPGKWTVRQKTGPGVCTITTVKASSAEEAMRLSNLRYVPANLT